MSADDVLARPLRRRLRRRRLRRPVARRRRRGPRQQPLRDRRRRLVQRPSGPRRPLRRPLGRTRGRRGHRQRRPRRRPHPARRPGDAREHRHLRRRPRRPTRQPDPRGRAPRPPRTGDGSLHRGEFLALRATPGLDVVLDSDSGTTATTAALADAPMGSAAAALADVDLVPVDWSAPPPDGKRIVLRFGSPVAALEGTPARTVPWPSPASASRTGPTIAAGLVIRSIGYRGRPFPGLPFDEASGTVPNDGGRVVDPADRRAGRRGVRRRLDQARSVRRHRDEPGVRRRDRGAPARRRRSRAAAAPVRRRPGRSPACSGVPGRLWSISAPRRRSTGPSGKPANGLGDRGSSSSASSRCSRPPRRPPGWTGPPGVADRLASAQPAHRLNGSGGKASASMQSCPHPSSR